MRGDKRQQVLQTVYDRFYGSGGTWPTLGYLQRTLNRQSNSNLDAVQIVQHIPKSLLKVFPPASGYPAPTAKLVLTIEGIERCSGSGEDIRNFIKAVTWLAGRADRFDPPSDQGERGVRFTPRQLAEAVPLSVSKDRRAVSRLLAMLRAEGLLVDDGDTSSGS